MQNVILIQVETVEDLASLVPDGNFLVQVTSTGQVFKGDGNGGVVEVPTSVTTIFANHFLLMGG